MRRSLPSIALSAWFAVASPVALATAMPPAPALPPAEPERMTLAPDAEAQWVDFTMTAGNQIQFRMAIDGREATAILDTGFSQSAIARRWATAQGLRIGEGGRGLGVGGTVALGEANGRTLTIGGLTRSGGRLAVLDLPAVATGGGATIDAVVGGDVLRHYALEIDFAARRFRLLPSGRMPFAGEVAPLAIRNQLYTTELHVGATRLRPVIVDTGDGSSLAMSGDAWRSLGALHAPTTTTISYSVAGPVQSDLAIVPGVAIGNAAAGESEALVEPGQGFLTRLGVAGRIGIGLLARFHVLLDPAAGRMVLAASPARAAAPLRSTSGLLLGEDKGQLQVLHVMRGSPAAAGGWRAGERICDIDGRPVPADYAADPIARWSVAPQGHVTRLRLCDGTVRDLTAARFY